MAETANESHERVFLVVVDKTEEMRLALRFACRRARNTDGRVALLYVIPPADFGHWMAVDDMIAEERRAEAEEKLQKLSEQVFEQTGKMPVVHIRQGDARDELLALIAEEPGISILVLAASPWAPQLFAEVIPLRVPELEAARHLVRLVNRGRPVVFES